MELVMSMNRLFVCDSLTLFTAHSEAINVNATGKMSHRLSASCLADGQPDRGVGLRPDGPRAAGGARLHPQHGEADQESRLQRAVHPEVHPQVGGAAVTTMWASTFLLPTPDIEPLPLQPPGMP